jgi:hypothetical protein
MRPPARSDPDHIGGRVAARAGLCANAAMPAPPGIRVAIAPGLLADLTAAAPARWIKKLDAAPETALAWTWAPLAEGGATVVTDSGETVRLSPPAGTVTDLAHLACTCLMTPRCLHVLSVAVLLEVAAEATAPPDAPAAQLDTPGSGPPEASVGPNRNEPARVPMSPAHRAAVLLARRAGARLLSEGAQSAGALARGEWLRAAHAAGAEGLPRLRSACLRVAAQLQAVSLRAASFRQDELVDAAAAALTLVHLLDADTADPVHVGVARRVYRTVGHLDLTGLFTEPVAPEGGARGVRTWLRDPAGRLYRVADVRPGEDTRVREAYDRGVEIGDVSASHRLVARAGLMLQDASTTDDGRLGAGKDVRAVVGARRPWRLDAPDAVFGTPPGRQVAALAGRAPDADPDGELVFFQATVLGAAGDRVLLDAGLPAPVSARTRTGAAGLPQTETLRALATAAGATVLCAGRVIWRPRPEIELLAVGGGPALPESWAGRCHVGLDRLQPGHLGATRTSPLDASDLEAAAPPDPFEPLRARLGRLVMGGRGVLTPTAVAHGLAAADVLEAGLAPAAGAALRALCAGTPTERPRVFAACHRLLAAADRALTVSAWGA